MSRIIDITYGIYKKNILTVDATVTEDGKVSSDSDTPETLLLTIYDPDTKDVLQQNSVAGVPPLKVSVEVYFTDLDEQGASCIAVANLSPVKEQSDNPLQNDQTRKQQEINIEKLQDILTPSCSYTMTSCVETGQPTVCSISKTKFMMQPDADYDLVGQPENASLLFAASSAEVIVYSGKIIYRKRSVRFPDKLKISDNSNAPLPLLFSCDVTLQQKSEPKIMRVGTLKFYSKRH